MPTVLPPARTELSSTYPNPTNAVARTGMGKFYDYVTNLLGTLGTAADARSALGAAASGANVDINTLGALASINGGPLAGLRNRLINPAFIHDQRNSGASTATADDTYCFDRWYALTQTG